MRRGVEQLDSRVRPRVKVRTPAAWEVWEAGRVTRVGADGGTRPAGADFLWNGKRSGRLVLVTRDQQLRKGIDSCSSCSPLVPRPDMAEPAHATHLPAPGGETEPAASVTIRCCRWPAHLHALPCRFPSLAPVQPACPPPSTRCTRRSAQRGPKLGANQRRGGSQAAAGGTGRVWRRPSRRPTRRERRQTPSRRRRCCDSNRLATAR